MERLTKRTANGKVTYAVLQAGECVDVIDLVRVWGVRLAAYEDTNLTPADINDLRNELCLKCGKYKDAHSGACDRCRWRKEQE